MKQKILCPLCKTASQTILFAQAKRTIVRCRRDGLIFVNPPLTDQEIEEMYNERYFDSDAFRGNTCIGYYAYIAERPLLVDYFKRKIAFLQTFVPKGKLLEIGCGHGFFLEALKKSPYKAIGIDISRYAVSYAKKEVGVDARVIDLFKAPFATQSFDAMVAFQLIEHVLDPVAFLKKAGTFLKPGGVLLLATPNEGGYLHTLLGKQWLSFRHREHLYFFSPQTIKLVLENAGFTDITFHKDETRWYPLRHVFGGIKYYLRGRFFVWFSNFLGKMGETLGILDVKIPLPLDTLIVVARKI